MTEVQNIFDDITGRTARKMAKKTEEQQRLASQQQKEESMRVKQKESLRAAEVEAEASLASNKRLGKRSLIRSRNLGG